jgi:hypothetical protein
MSNGKGIDQFSPSEIAAAGLRVELHAKEMYKVLMEHFGDLEVIEVLAALGALCVHLLQHFNFDSQDQEEWLEAFAVSLRGQRH